MAQAKRSSRTKPKASWTAGVPKLSKSDRNDPKAALAVRQRQLSLLQQAYARTGRKALIVLEGHDAAGKGGIIRRLGWALDPRGLNVHSTSAPNGLEAQQHWLKRFWRRVPDAGEWVVFDRSYYGRVLVERVEGFADPVDWKRAYNEINAFERTLSDEGVRIVKLLLEISLETQFERFRARYENPEKRWKLTEEDIRNRARYDDYTVAYDEMVKRTDERHAPWHRIDANDKRKPGLLRLTYF